MNSMIKNPSVTVADVAIGQDNDGRYCLNDLHKAAGGEKRHGASYWLANQQTIDLVKELETTGNPVVTLEGRNGGTFVVKELVYAYAMWISPVFNLKVIRTFDDVMTNDGFRLEHEQVIKPHGSARVNTDSTKSFKAFFSVAKLLGLDKNAAAISANITVSGVFA